MVEYFSHYKWTNRLDVWEIGRRTLAKPEETFTLLTENIAQIEIN
jgi:hypothetical protein